MVARRRTASIRAKPPPIQMRGPPPKGKYAYLGSRFAKPSAPAVRHESFGIREVAGAAMYHPLTHEERGALGHHVPADLAVLQRLPTKSVGGRIEAQRFPHDVFRIGQPGEIRHAGRVTAEDRLELGPELGFDVWMLRQQAPRPRQAQE